MYLGLLTKLTCVHLYTPNMVQDIKLDISVTVLALTKIFPDIA